MTRRQDQNSPRPRASVLPVVRYHPSIQVPSKFPGSSRTQSHTATTSGNSGTPAAEGENGPQGLLAPAHNQTGNQTRTEIRTPTGDGFRPVLPQVRYHPSIRTSAPRAQSHEKVPEHLQTIMMSEEQQNSSSAPKATKHKTKPVPEPRIGCSGAQRPHGGAAADTAGFSPCSAGGDASDSRELQTQEGTGQTSQSERPEGTEPAAAPRKATRKSKKHNCEGAPGPEAAPEDEQTRNTFKTWRNLLDPGLVEPRPGSELDLGLVEQVEVWTRGQRTNPEWFRFRKNRITASVAHSVARSRFANGKTSTPPTSYVSGIIGEGRPVQTRAMVWGVEHETEAVLRYKEQRSAALGHPVQVQDCGLFIDPTRPWLAASPDGIVTDGFERRCLEVKCPFKHRTVTVATAAATDPAFCLERLHQEGAPQLSLKRTHPYFTQVQCQLAVTGLKMADFVVFTLKDLAVVQVPFDPDFWDQTVRKLELFYRDAVIPALRQRNPAWRPEI